MQPALPAAGLDTHEFTGAQIPQAKQVIVRQMHALHRLAGEQPLGIDSRLHETRGGIARGGQCYGRD